MEAEDVALKKADVSFERPDLSSLTVEELEERISFLRTEIERCEEMIESKKETKTAAETVFKM